MARKPKAPAALTMPDLPPVPPPSAEDIAREKRLLEDMQAMTERLRQRNLDNAVLLAQQAARGKGPLIDHFHELGRRFVEALDAPPKPTLKIVKGGAQ